MPTQNGTNGADTLTGTAGDDILNGLGGDDILLGLGGNDILNGGDEKDRLEGGDNDDVLNGGFGDDTLYGGNDNDTLNGESAEDKLYGGDGNDILDGGSTIPGVMVPSEFLYGEGGNDVLKGGGSQDMYGGTGDDIYYVNQDGSNFIAGFHWPADRVFEYAGEGFDTVYASVPFTLAAGMEVEVLAGDPASASGAFLTGNELANTLLGKAISDDLKGMGGTDILWGFGDIDQLSGGDGDDYLVGGAGNDTMTGGAGSDTYYVEDAGDVVVEAVAAGTDRVAASVSYALGADADIETLEAVNLGDTTAMDLTGNQFGQGIIGNAGVNRLDGGGGNDELVALAGNDTLIGGAGDDILVGGSGADSMNGGDGSDTYYIDDLGDVMIDAVAPGTDRAATSISYALGADVDIELYEAITLSATNALNLTGNQFGQTILGNNGANTIDGKGGADVLVGLGGADIFAFTSTLHSSNIDLIDDFTAVDDTIALDDAVFTGLTPGALSASAFVVGSAAGDADDRIIYNSATGALYFDADGNGAGAMVQFATLNGAPTITASDFTVI